MRRGLGAALLSAMLALSTGAAADAPAGAEPAGAEAPQAGFRDGFFLRDARDRFRLYPTGLVHLDFYSSFGPGVVDAAAPRKTALAPDVASGLTPHLLVRRARLGLAGELFGRWSFAANVEFGGQPLGNAAGSAETAAAKVGAGPVASSGRYAAVQTVTSSITPLDAYLNYSVAPYLNFMVGQMQMPFSLENQTPDAYGAWLERNLPIRAFVVPGPRDLGGTVWGQVGSVLSYALGVFGGDGQNRPSVDARVDFMGRIYVRPFAAGATSDLAKYFQLGVSARHGDRDATKVGYDYTPITTAQGFVLWKPTYTDSQKRLVHILPSGAQNAAGGELRLRTGRFALRGEAYYVANDTREAVDGYQLTNTERLGRLTGVGWYGQVSAWPWGDAFVAPDPGVYRPRHVDVSAPPPDRAPHGLEVKAIVAGVNAAYAGAARLGSKADASTPSGRIDIYQLGLDATYWHTRFVRFSVNYLAYVTPGSGTKDNTAVVPDNLRKLDDGAPGPGHVLHELGARLAVTF
jgi:hypothetical protein